MSKRAMIFMDHQNFIISLAAYYKTLDFHSPSIDYEKLATHISTKIGCEFMKMYVFAPIPDAFLMKHYKWQNYCKLIEGLRNRDSIVVYDSRIISRATNGWENAVIDDYSTYKELEKGTDVNLASELLIKGFFNAYDTAIIMSGDSDFEESIRTIRMMGKSVVVAAIEGQPTRRLSSFSDKTISLGKDVFEECKIRDYTSRLFQTI